MNFFIKQNSTLPLIKLEVYKDGRSDFKSIQNTFNSSSVYFNLIDVETGIPKVTNKPMSFLIDETSNGVSPFKTLLYIQLSSKDTKKTGKFKLSIFIDYSYGKIELPLKEDVFVYITESFILNDLTFSNKYVVNNPCCF